MSDEKIKISELPLVGSYVNLYTIGTDGSLNSVKVPLYILSQVGDLSALHTSDKSSIVGAINEVKDNGGGGGGASFSQVAVIITDNTPGTPTAEAVIVNDTLTLTFHHLKGDKGDSAEDLDNLVYIGIDEGPTLLPLPYYEEQSNKVTEIDENSTDEQYPSAKCVYLALQQAGGGSVVAFSPSVNTGDKIGTITIDSTPTDLKAGTIIYPLADNSSATAGTWLASNSDITELYDGLTVRYKVTVAGDSTTTLKVNNLTAKTVYLNGSTKLTTQYAVGSYLILYYSSSLNSGSWIVYSGYDSNTNTYQRLYPSTGDTEYPITSRYNTTSGSNYYAEYGRYVAGVTLNPSKKSITATKFIVTGGTSSGFLKADGSVDTTEFATKNYVDGLVGDIETLLAAI